MISGLGFTLFDEPDESAGDNDEPCWVSHARVSVSLSGDSSITSLSWKGLKV